MNQGPYVQISGLSASFSFLNFYSLNFVGPSSFTWGGVQNSAQAIFLAGVIWTQIRSVGEPPHACHLVIGADV